MLDKDKLIKLIDEIIELGHEPSTRELSAILRRYSKPKGGFYSKFEILKMAEDLYSNVGNRYICSLQEIRRLLRLKPTRTISGVAPITIFTKPYPCPGKCIFCPSQEGMPKSYLQEEPGAMRGKSLKFDPYDQVKLRIQALSNIGHNVDKIEIIISGGTWSAYPKDYREWFIEQTFKALNETAKYPSHISPTNLGGDEGGVLRSQHTGDNLSELHKLNETAKHRCVGLVIETRPDFINEDEVLHLRKLGVTKVQLGIQTLNDDILQKNKRGHTADDSRNAVNLLRLAGLKIHIHWMANLFGSSIEEDYEDFKKLFEDGTHCHPPTCPTAWGIESRVSSELVCPCHPELVEGQQGSTVTSSATTDVLRQAQDDICFRNKKRRNPTCPDELKIYPCSVLAGTKLFELMKEGKHKPYEEEDLINLLIKCKQHVPQYCRISRIVRDIPSQLIEGGSKTTNLRQLVQAKMKEQNLICSCIRCREIRNEEFDPKNLKLEILDYETEVSKECFLSFTIQSPSDNLSVEKEGVELGGSTQTKTTPSNSHLSGGQQISKVIAFLRLSLPKKELSKTHFIEELKNSAIIREVHVYGRALKIKGIGESQHLGMGKKLIDKSKEIAKDNNYKKLCVISAMGTKDYYRNNGFEDGELYQHIALK